jgi:YegS/Rv2252/BmrU family lipid kinase
VRSVKFLYNPSSGEGIVADRLDEIVAVHQKHGYSIIPYRLLFAPDQDEQILSGLDDSFSHVLVAGGDGTVNYAINLLSQSGLDLPVAMLPAGTANDFASLFVTTSDPVKACEKLLGGEVRRVDLGLANGTYFANVFSCGLFSDISQKTPTILKNTFGRLAYYVSGLGDLTRLRRMELSVETDAGSYRGPALMFFVFNGRTAGKLRIAYLSDIEDGLLDVLIIKGDNPVENMHTMFHYLTHLTRVPKKYPAGMVHIRCTRLEVHTDSPEVTDVDGQPGPQLPVRITCCKGALGVLAPQQKMKSRIK